jgi:hypothetical protein
MPERPPWGACRITGCGHAPAGHEAVVIRPVCIDPGNRVLFEGTLGACQHPGCPCPMYDRATVHRCPPDDGDPTPCCGLTPFEVSRYDRLTLDAEKVTCRG